jgi:hypothetical protein
MCRRHPTLGAQASSGSAFHVAEKSRSCQVSRPSDGGAGTGGGPDGATEATPDGAVATVDGSSDESNGAAGTTGGSGTAGTGGGGASGMAGASGNGGVADAGGAAGHDGGADGHPTGRDGYLAGGATATSAVRARGPRASFFSLRSRSSRRGEGADADCTAGHSEPPTQALSRSATLPRNCSSILWRARSASSRAPFSRTSGPTAISISMRASC